MKTKLLLIVLASLTSASLFAADSPKVGSAAPDFSLADAKGKMHSVSENKGKFVVLEWFNPECPFVRKHYSSGNMQKLQQEYSKKGVVWMSIDSSASDKEGAMTAEEANKQTGEWKMDSTTLLLDPAGKAGQAYGAKNTPHMFVISPEGKIVYEGAIDNKPTVNVADIPTATNYVKAALDQAMAGQPVTTANTRPYGCSVKY